MKPLIFGVMADCQYADVDNTTAIVPNTNHLYDNRYRLGIGKLRQAVDAFNEYDLDFVIHLGDFIDRRLDDVDMLAPIVAQLRAPLLHVLGNHDFSGSEGVPEKVLAKFGLEKSYYSRVIKDVRLIVLDTNELGVIKYQENSPQWRQGRQKLDELQRAGALQAYDWNGGVGARQLTWLDAELTQAELQGEKVVLFSHHPVFPPHPLNALDDSAILAVIDRHNSVVVYINGHNHIGEYGERQGVPYVTMPGMLQGKTNAYGVVTLGDGTLRMQGYGRVQDRLVELD